MFIRLFCFIPLLCQIGGLDSMVLYITSNPVLYQLEDCCLQPCLTCQEPLLLLLPILGSVFKELTSGTFFHLLK